MVDIMISVIICTRNRVDDLPDAIRSVWMQDFSSTYELLVVDNGSSDGTQAYLKACLEQSPIPMEYVYEGTPGLSLARNTGARVARGDILAYLDDDAIASENWLTSLNNSYDRYQETWVAGGPILLDWRGEKPLWFTSDMEMALTTLDLGSEFQWLDGYWFPFGANFSCRKAAWSDVGGFGEVFTLYNDERYFCHKVRSLEGKIAYIPSAVVLHKVSAYRLRTGQFIKRNYRQGRADAIFHKITSDNQKGSSLFKNLKQCLFVTRKSLIRMIGEIETLKDVFEPATYFRIGYQLGTIQGTFESHFGLSHET